MVEAHRHSALRTRTILYISFFVSGISAIIYQLVWQRDLFRMFGVNIESVTAVVTAFMIGLGSGGLLGSWLSRRRLAAPLLIFALMEATIAGFGLVSLRIFTWVGVLFGASSLSMRTLVAIAVLIIPTGCMGATLPLLVGHAVRKSVNVGASTGRLYYINTLGAVVGCFVAAMCIFPFLGISAALRIAASLNVLAGCGAGIAYWRSKPDSQVTRGSQTDLTAQRPRPGAGPAVTYPVALFLAGFSGFMSLSYEIFFFRVAAFASGGNSVVFALVLAAVLLGIASGAREVSEWAEVNDGVPPRFLTALIWASVAGLFALPMMAHSDVLPMSLVFGLLPLAIIVANALGAVFPLVAHLAIPADEKAGFRVGLVYAMNILGAALGTLFTGFVLAQILGLRGLAMLLAAFTLCLAGVIALSVGSAQWRRPTNFQTFGLISAALLLSCQAPLTGNLFQTMVAKVNSPYAGKVRDVIESRSGIIVVNQYGTVYGGGVYDGAFNIDPYNDINGIIRPYSLSLFQAAPKEVLMIGLSSGSWAQVVANNPDVGHLRVIEIDPGYLSLIRRTAIVKSLLTNPKVTVVLDDGHRWLEAHPEAKFDAILSNTTYHYRSNSSNLLSVEFDRMIQEHLNPKGVFFFNATGSIRAQRTACLSFKYGFRVLNHVMVSDSPFDLDPVRWRRVLLAYTIDGKRMLPIDSPAQLDSFTHFADLVSDIDNTAISPADRRIESCNSVLQRTDALPLITDDNMGTEWRYPLLHRE